MNKTLIDVEDKLTHFKNEHIELVYEYVKSEFKDIIDLIESIGFELEVRKVDSYTFRWQKYYNEYYYSVHINYFFNFSTSSIRVDFDQFKNSTPDLICYMYDMTSEDVQAKKIQAYNCFVNEYNYFLRDKKLDRLLK